MNSMLTVIRFTFLSRFRSKSFRVMSLILIVLLSVLINLPTLIDKMSSHEATGIAVVGGEASRIAERLEAYYSQQEQPDIRIVPLAEGGDPEAAARQMIADKKIKGYLQIADAAAGEFPQVTYKSEGSLEFSLKNKLQTALQQVKTATVLEGAKLTADQQTALRTPVNLATVQISASGEAAGGKSESQMVMAYALVYALLFLLYMGVVGFGNMVAMEITAEKSSRVMEVLITSVAPLKQMFGKIIGICLLALVQIALIIAVAAVNLGLSGNGELVQELHLSWADLQVSLIFYFLIFYLLGFFIYATLFAAVGSLVSRTEEVGQAIMPVMMIIVAAFMIAIFGLNNPTAGYVKVMSFMPFFSPLIMFLRIGMTSPAVWEVWLAIALQAAAIVGMAWIAAKIYRTGVLMYGKRPSLRELRKAMKAFKV
ncbi:ABC transporter permease [Paenibacillus athensensis]|uniref:ABC-2 type transporter transmembrane domain-containing protein n=1 Tax=Paenibacillus athensensis TaxID=1967502 RepID=A0A4Y8PZA7_9BACL|nr:ABC transporter permease [Paenibacillus athensensis]MCD1259694.1 ABC transporter permease [Paenibacillus athensensis]